MIPSESSDGVSKSERDQIQADANWRAHLDASIKELAGLVKELREVIHSRETGLEARLAKSEMRTERLEARVAANEEKHKLIGRIVWAVVIVIVGRFAQVALEAFAAKG